LDKFRAKRTAKLKNGGTDLTSIFSPCSEYRDFKFSHHIFLSKCNNFLVQFAIP